MVRIALYQTNTGIDPAANTAALEAAVAEAAQGGAQMLFTPEMSGLLDKNRKRAADNVKAEGESEVLAAMQAAAKRHGIWLHIGSLAMRRDDAQDTRWANRSFLIAPDGAIAARYDKIHMFDVDLKDGASGESWRESNGFAPGEKVVSAKTPLGVLGFAICYDMRFPALWEALGNIGCDAIACPASFTVPTGRAHWHLLLRARAVEATSYVIAAAQVGSHEDGRRTYGHSLVVDPWGEVLLDMGGEGAGIGFAEIDPERIAEVRAQLPSLANRRAIAKPRAS